MSALLLDTHAWVWWTSRPEHLSRSQRAAIERALRSTSEPLLLSIISCWEVALLCQHRRFRFAIPVDAWLEEIRALKRAGRIADANTLRAEFQKRFPDMTLPDDLR